MPETAARDAAFLADLARFGPSATYAPVPLAEAEAYCRKLARRHYENFVVATGLLPKRIQQPFYNVYSYCRWSDDLADEVADPAEAARLLDWWEGEFDAALAGAPRHPVMVALVSTIRSFDLPEAPFRNLLVAFRRDQTQTRQPTWETLFDYCRHSANPVGRIILALADCRDEARGALSDSICTGLQLANFWQDVARDFARGRIYLPQEAWRKHGLSEATFAAGVATPEFRRAIRDAVERAEACFEAGRPLLAEVPKWLRIDLELFIEGGRAVLHRIRLQDYDVQRRPKVGKLTQMFLLGRAILRQGWPGG